MGSVSLVGFRASCGFRAAGGVSYRWRRRGGTSRAPGPARRPRFPAMLMVCDHTVCRFVRGAEPMRQVSKLVFMVALLVSGMAIASNDLFVRVRSPLLGRVASSLGVGKLGKSL